MVLRDLRRAKGITLMGLAHITGSTPSWLTYIEKYNHVPGAELRERIAAALGVDVMELWPDLDNRDLLEQSECSRDVD